MNEKYEVYGVKGIRVYYTDELDGGGNCYGKQFLRDKNIAKIRDNFKHEKSKLTCMEFCAGPGFIGFSLLDSNFCDEVVFVEINPEAVELIKKTIKENGFEKVARVYLSDGLDNVPKTEKFDYVVSNPPHFKDKPQLGLIGYDKNWELHRRFYKQIVEYLKPDGSIIFQENYLGSDETDFIGMIKDSGLNYIETYMADGDSGKPASFQGLPKQTKDGIANTIYFIHSKRYMKVKLSDKEVAEIRLRPEEKRGLIMQTDGKMEKELVLSNGKDTFFNRVPLARIKKGKNEFKTCNFYLTRGNFFVQDRNGKVYVKITV